MVLFLSSSKCADLQWDNKAVKVMFVPLKRENFTQNVYSYVLYLMSKNV